MMDDLPPPPPPVTGPPLPPPDFPPSVAYRNYSGTSRLLWLAVGFVALLVLFVLFLLLKKTSPRPVSLAPAATPASSAFPLSTGNPSPGVAPVAPRLPLTVLSGHQLITAAAGKLWLIDFTAQGPRKTQLLDVKNQIMDISLSPNRQFLAYTYADSAKYSPAMAGFPKTGLSVMDLSTHVATEFIPIGDLSIRRPTWSPDSVYLAVWNNGSSDTLFDMTNKRRVKDLASAASHLGQIVFVPGQAKFSYVDGGVLYEVPYTVDDKTKVVEGVNSILSFTGQPLLPDLHYYPGSSAYLLYHNTRGQLILFNRGDSSTQILAESIPGYPFGGVVTYNSEGILVYYNQGQDHYTPGIDDNPLYIYNLSDRSGRPFFANRKTPVSMSTLTPDPNHAHLLVTNTGFQVYSLSGNMEADCPYTVLNNSASYAPETLWTPDSKYVLSTKSVQVVDAFSCAITTEFDDVTPDLAIWLK